MKVPTGWLQWTPVVDGVDVIDTPTTLLAQGKVADVPVIFGTNRDEGTAFNSCPVDMPADQYLSFMRGL